MLGYKLGVYGDPHVPASAIGGEELFKRRTDRFSLDSIVLRTALASRDVYLHGPDQIAEILRGRGLNSFAMFAPLLRRVVSHAIERRALPDTATREMTGVDLVRATEAVMSWSSQTDFERNATENSVEAMFFRMLQQQAHDQLPHGWYARELSIARSTVSEAMKLGLDLEAVYEDQLGVTFSELAALSFGAFSSLGHGEGAPFLNPDAWGQLQSPIGVEPGRVRRFLESSSIDYAGFQQKARQVAVPGFEAYALSPLIQWPLIRTSAGALVAPIIRDVLERPTRALTIEGLRLSKAHGGKAAESWFTNAVGSAYQDFIERCLRAALGDRVRRGREVITRGPNCDFVVMEPAGVCLVEVKSSRISVLVDSTKRRSDIKAQMMADGGVVHGLAQIAHSADAIRRGETELPKGIPLVGLLILRGEQVLLNHDYVAGILREGLSEVHPSPIRLQFQLANDIDTDALVRMTTENGSLTKWLFEKARGRSTQGLPKWSQWDLHLAVSREFPNLGPHPLHGDWLSCVDELLGQFGIVDSDHSQRSAANPSQN